jgi:ubiquinone/menaquinone biosynthesis C-methylase UbiE
VNYKQQVWEAHHYRFGLAGEGQADIIERMLRLRIGRVLNVGCGRDGRKVETLAACCGTQIALDHDENMVAAARSCCGAHNVHFVVADGHRTPFADNSMDHVVALGLFAYVIDRMAMFTELRRVCRPGGTVMVTNAALRPKDEHREAGEAAGLRLIEEAEGYCPAAVGDVKRRYLLVFEKPAPARPTDP